MIAKALSVLTVAAVLVSVTLGWKLSSQIESNESLAELNRQLCADLSRALVENDKLATAIRSVVEEGARLQNEVLSAERRKTQIARENETLRSAIDGGIKDAPAWADAPVPDSVRRHVRAAIDRLYLPAAVGNNPY